MQCSDQMFLWNGAFPKKLFHQLILPLSNQLYQRLMRQFERTLAQLRQIQAERRKNEQRQLDNAAKILKMHQDQNSDQPSAYNPADDGFVFSPTQITQAVRARKRERLSSEACNRAAA